MFTVIVVRLDNTEIQGALSKVRHIVWDKKDRDKTERFYNDLHTTVRACCDTVVKIAELKLHVGPNGVYRMSLSKNADYALFCQYDSPNILVLDTATGGASETFSSRSFSKGEKKLHDVKWSNDQFRALTCGDDGIVRLWNVSAEHLLARSRE